MNALGCWRSLMMALVALLLGAYPQQSWSQASAPEAESTYVKLLKRAPEARLGTIIEVIGKRGNAVDLTYLFDRATTTGPTAFAPMQRRQALEALDEAAALRNLRPTTDLADLNRLIAPEVGTDHATQAAAIRLAGTWRLAGAVVPLTQVADREQGTDPAARLAAIDALARIGTDPARAAIGRLAGSELAPEIQRASIAALVKLDIAAAADRTAAIIASATPNQDLAPLVSSFLDRQGGSDRLLAAINRRPPGADGARLALRAIAALGRSDETLVAGLSKFAGVETDPPPPTPSEMAALTAQVTAAGDPARGEQIFRRAEINCTKCHAIAGAGGGVGPDLSALGLSSPVDYIVNSILIPDQAIKEEYQTRVISTDDGRVLQGIVVEEDHRRVVLKDATGDLRVVPAATIEESKRGGSLMPRGLVGTLTRSEFVDLVRFLAELGRPGPYAIRATPTIQRWRALHPVPAALLTSAAPPIELFRSEVLGAPPSAWSPAYAWTSGDLPVREVVGTTGDRVGLVQGEMTVSTAGFVQFRFAPHHLADQVAWLDDRPMAIGSDGTATLLLDAGTRRLTVRVDARNHPESAWAIRVEVARAQESPAEFSVVGGR